MLSEFPKRAVVTVGMPYANKGLHFGHVGGVFIPADCYARFLRDRIGPEHVLFVSGTDCYGSPIDEGYRRLMEDGAFSGTVLEYVERNHQSQSAALAAYDISLDIYEGSGLGSSKDVHEQLTREVIEKLYEKNWLSLDASTQFYDTEAQVLLNGRQVIGHCPVQGCKSQHAYADECDLGHQYRPQDLLSPKSTISGTTPELREAYNWYFALPRLTDLLKEYVAWLREDELTRRIVPDTINEFLGAPVIHVKQEFLDTYLGLAAQLPEHSYRPVPKGKASFELEFSCLASRDTARTILDAHGVRLRTGKALVPFRITGNVAWGVPAPVLEGVEDLTVWCWPESLWAPISFSRAWLESAGGGVETLNPASKGRIQGSWQDFWCSSDATVYQFIGQDNIYFYGVAQTALWSALARGPEESPIALPEEGQLQQSRLVANFHLLFGDRKASSSGELKPPMATDLLEYYTVEQLRAHFIALGLNRKTVSFNPKALDPNASPTAPDPVLKESALLTNIFNRLARSCFYEAQRSFDGRLPLVSGIAAPLVQDATQTMLDYERAMYTTELHTAFDLASEFIRRANKYWSEGIRAAGDRLDARREVLASAFYLLRIATVLMHPIVPAGTERIFAQMNFDVSAEEFFSWERMPEGNEAFFSPADVADGGHPLQELPPRFDFFERHASQL
ncbi:MAG: class I tRNA ligase family protein [Coriobacteriales bacterium]|jgi:methionyl-tRNA synthetase|nr:class I tRNA ligase family protein [Coriobacteriales bacterium]